MSQSAQTRYALEAARIAIDTDDQPGVIVRVDGCVVAILIRLESDYYAEDRGRWYVEACFGPCAGTLPATFASLSDGLLWVVGRLGDKAADLGDLLVEADRSFGSATPNVIPFPGRPTF